MPWLLLLLLLLLVLLLLLRLLLLAMLSRSLLNSAGESRLAVTALEDLQALAAFATVSSAHLPLRQHGLTNARPEVSGTAQSFTAVGGPKARLPISAYGSTMKYWSEIESKAKVSTEVEKSKPYMYLLVFCDPGLVSSF